MPHNKPISCKILSILESNIDYTCFSYFDRIRCIRCIVQLSRNVFDHSFKVPTEKLLIKLEFHVQRKDHVRIMCVYDLAKNHICDQTFPFSPCKKTVDFCISKQCSNEESRILHFFSVFGYFKHAQTGYADG